MATRHSLLTGTQLHQPFPYEQTSDPGAVGAGKFWYDTTNNLLKRRNGANTGWTSHGGAGYGVMLEEGATEAALLAAYAALPSTGGTIWLPNSLIVLTACLQITTKPVKIFGTTANSGLEINGDIEIFGSKIMIYIANVTGVELGHFRIIHDRAAGGSTMRTLTIDIQTGASYINIHHIAGVDLTSDFLIIRPNATTLDSNPSLTPHHIYFDNNTCSEWYESYINMREGSGHHIYARGNTGTVSAGHPNGTISRPYGFSLAVEADHGTWEDVEWSFNSLTNTMTSKTNSLGGIISYEDIDASGVYYNRISIYGNTWTGWWTGFLVTMIHNQIVLSSSPAIVTIDSNIWYTTTNKSLDIRDVGGYSLYGDRLFLLNNKMDTSAGGSGIVYEDPGTVPGWDVTITDINNTTF